MTTDPATPAATDPAAPEDYVIIIGSMKSGTTTLFAMLADHPQIAPAKPKEPGFFAFPDIYAKGFAWYHSLFAFDPGQHRYRLEASTDYTKAPFVTGVWDRMQARPGARYKLIYIMRHPLRRIESHARHVQLKKKEIGQQITARTDHGLDNGVSLASLAMTRYAHQLDGFGAAHAAGDLFVTTLEDLKAAPDQVMAQLCGFLDLPLPPPAQKAPQANAAKDKVKMHGSWGRLTGNPALLALGKLLMPQSLRDRIKARFVHKVSLEGRFTLTPAEEAAISDQLRADLARLQAHYGVDVDRVWGLPGDRLY